jgi:ribosomal protein S27AE
MNPKPVFENQICSRCGGSGSFSFNHVHGTRCYGCSGCGYELTKRGRAAQGFLDALRSVQAPSIKVGDLIQWDTGNKKVFGRVVSIEVNGERFMFKGIQVKTGEAIAQGFVTKSMVRLGFSIEQKQAQVNAALAYQDSLNKDGKPSKKSHVDIL